ncbi:MAG: phage tail tape measure protein [Pseudomonadota bacterium]
MPEVDPVILRLEAEVRDYNAKIAGAQKLTDQKLDQIEARGRRMGEGLRKGFDLAKGAAVAYAAAVAIPAITNAIKSGLEYASSLGEVAQQLGVTTDALQEYRFAGSQAGLSTEETDQALSQLTRRLGEAATGTKAQAEAFAGLGITVKDVEGNVLNAADAIPLIADALQKVENPAERAAILMDLFGRSGQKLEALLAGGSAGINNLRDAAQKLGIVLSPELINRADEAADKLSALKQVLEARIAGAVAENVGGIVALANALAGLVEILGRAGTELKRFKIAQGEITETAKSFNPFATPAERATAARRAERFALEQRRLDGNIDKSGSFRDYTVAGLGLKLGSPNGGVLGTPAAVGSGVSVPKAGVGAGVSSGPSAAEIEDRFQSERAALGLRAIAALRSQATSAEDRAERERQALELDIVRTAKEIRTDEDYNAAQKAVLLAQLDRVAEAERENVEREKRAELEADAAQAADLIYQATDQTLRLQLDLADTQADRKRIALEILAAEQRHLESVQEAVIASDLATDAEKERARLILAQVQATGAAKADAVSRANETETERYLRDLRKSPGQINEAIDGIKIDGLEALNDGLVDAITGAKSLGSVFKNVANQIIADLLRIAIQQAVIRPLAEALGGGGGLSGIISGIGAAVGGGFGGGTTVGRASGGYVAPGQTYRVNEGASPGRVEAFMSRDGGTIIPLGQMNAMRAGGQQSGIATVRIELSGDVDGRIQRVSGPVAVEIIRAAAPALIDASARETLARAGRPKV